MRARFNIRQARRGSASVALAGILGCSLLVLAVDRGCPGLDGTLPADDIWSGDVAVEELARSAGPKTGTHQAACIPGADICDRSIGPYKCMLNVFGSGHIQNKSIQSWDVADNAVGSRVLANKSVRTSHIADGAITSAKLDTNLAVQGDIEVGDDVNPRNDRQGDLGNSSDAWYYLYVFRVLPGNSALTWRYVGSDTNPFNWMYAFAYYTPSSSAQWDGRKTLGRDDCADILEAVETASVATFFLRDERLLEEQPDETGDLDKADGHIPRTVPYLGVDAESLPPEVLDSSRTAVNLGAHTAMLHAAVKELSTRVREQQAEIDELRRRLDALEQTR